MALEAAVAELGALYATARGFTALQARAEGELLPQVTALSSRLRRLVRRAELTDAAIELIARELLAAGSQWHLELQRVRDSTAYQRAVAALRADAQATLAELIPQVFADLRVIVPAPTLYFPVSPSSGRRRPGGSPFLSPPACADRLLQMVAEGLDPDASEEWWDQDLPSLTCAGTPAALESPIALCLASEHVRVTVFGAADGAMRRVFTRHLRGPLSITLAADATDERWEAYADSYRAFRDALHAELGRRGVHATIVDG